MGPTEEEEKEDAGTAGTSLPGREAPHTPLPAGAAARRPCGLGS
jgi:hypothetical protein